MGNRVSKPHKLAAQTPRSTFNSCLLEMLLAARHIALALAVLLSVVSVDGTALCLESSRQAWLVAKVDEVLCA